MIVNAWKNVFSQVVNGTKAYLRPLSSAVISQSQTLAAQNTSSVALLPQVRCFQTSPVTRDIDSAAKFIGAGAATVGVAGSGKCRTYSSITLLVPSFIHVTVTPLTPFIFSYDDKMQHLCNRVTFCAAATTVLCCHAMPIHI